MAAPKTPPRVTLDDAQLRLLLADPRARQELGFLATAHKQAARPRAQAQAKRAGCGGCGRRLAGATVDYKALRLAVVALPSAEKKKLKQLLGAKQVVVDYVEGGRKTRLKF